MTREIALTISHHVVNSRNLLSRFFLGALVAAIVALPGWVVIANARAQTKAAATDSQQIPSFEVASVRPDHSDASFNSHLTLDRFFMQRWRVKDLIEYSYSVTESQILNGPKWINFERYDIEAKLRDADVLKEQTMALNDRIPLMRLRVRDLLANRFGLRIHHSMRKLPVIALVLAKEGPKFSVANPSSLGGHTDGQRVDMTMDGKEWVLIVDREPLRYLTLALVGQPEIGGRILVDQTGLQGDFSFKLRWQLQDLTTAPSGNGESSGASLFTALRDQLGLKLESRKELVDVLIIDHIETPSAD